MYLINFFCVCSSFDEYSAELKSGRLEWSPVHKSNKFWVNTEYHNVLQLVLVLVYTFNQLHPLSPSTYRGKMF